MCLKPTNPWVDAVPYCLILSLICLQESKSFLVYTAFNQIKGGLDQRVIYYDFQH